MQNAKCVECIVFQAFAEPKRINTVVIDSNVRHLDIEVEKDGVWRKVADIKTDKHDLRREVQTIKFPLVETKKLQLQCLKVKDGGIVGGEKVIQIWEIEGYGM